MVKLKDKTHALVSISIQSGHAHLRQHSALKPYFALIRPVQSTEQMQQRTLAAAGCPHNGHKFIVLYLEVYSLEDRNPGRSHTIGFNQLIRFQYDAFIRHN